MAGQMTEEKHTLVQLTPKGRKYKKPQSKNNQVLMILFHKN
jgi:hypothetical protein